VVVIDDGSTDATVAVALAHGAHVVANRRNLGLAQTFVRGLEECLSLGADVIVNTDADNQYCADDIPLLTAPILAGRADMVVGARPIRRIEGFSATKKLMQRLGSAVVRWLSNTSVPDAPSGFRAFSRRAAAQLNVFTAYTYTLETLIQAGQKRLAVCSVPVRVNPQTRPSRLVRSTFDYICRSLLTMVRIAIIYRPLRLFIAAGSFTLLLGLGICLRFTWLWALGHGDGKVQSLIAGALLIGLGVHCIMMGIIADLIATNRKLLEKIDLRVSTLERPPS